MKRAVASQQPKHAGRRGAVVVVAIICLFLTTVLLGSLLKLSLAQRRQTKADQRLAQAEWLAQSALERAAYRVATDDDYGGETWRITANELDVVHGGRVDITVEPAEGGGRVVTVEARYPAEAAVFATRSKRAILNMTSTTGAESDATNPDE